MTAKQLSIIRANVVCSGDVTYIPTRQGWRYLAMVIDLYARNIIGFARSDSPKQCA